MSATKHSLAHHFQGLQFDAPSHTYTDPDGQVLTSVTTVTDALTEPFDAPYWSMYKSLQKHGYRVRPWKGRRMIQVEGGDWLDFRELLHLLPESEIDRLQGEWKAGAQAGRDRGTHLHTFAEEVKRGTLDRDHFPGLAAYLDGIEGETVHMELRMYAGLLSGTLDRLNYVDGQYVLHDYKTNKKIEMQNRWDKMLPPFQHIEASTWNKYRAQLAGYALLLYFGADVTVKRGWIHHINEVGGKGYPVDLTSACQDFYPAFASLLSSAGG